MDQICLFHRNARLVPYTDEYNGKTVEWLNNHLLQYSFGLSRSVSIEAHIEWLSLQKDYLLWAILNRENVHVGNVSLKLNLKHLSAYFQIYLGDEKVRGAGLGWSSLISVLEYAFVGRNLNRVWLHTFLDNKVAINLYKKAGFIQEGIERAAIFRNGRFEDQLRWSLLQQEWNTKRDGVFR